VKPFRNAFTLLEVIVGLVLMGSLVTSALVALSSHQHSILLAKRKQQANQIAETLLTHWYELQDDVPTRGQGLLETNGVWLWRTQLIGSQAICGLPVNVVRLEVLGQVGTKVEPQVLVAIELVQDQSEAGL
jgi:prepilin-type N-terminal cleavage/methylation domain-containing protein